MKPGLQKVTMFFIFLISPLWLAAATYTSIDNGNWKDSKIWDKDDMPSYTNDLNQDVVDIYHDVVLDDTFEGKNGFILNIHEYATLTITGDFEVGNNVQINVEGTGELIIEGNFYAHNNANVFIQGNVTVDGDMTFWNGGDITMIDGNLNVGGELCGKTGTGLLVSGDEGSTLVYGSICQGGVAFNGDVITLPIELISFSAAVKDLYVEMNWTTASEINNDFFTIERSPDMVSWEVIGFMQGAGHSNNMLSYTFTDMMPKQGLAYYKLKQTDYDGKSEYFSPLTVMYLPGMEGLDFRVAKQSGQWVIGLPNDEQCLVEVFTLGGQKIISTIAVNNVTIPAPSHPVVIRVYNESRQTASRIVI